MGDFTANTLSTDSVFAVWLWFLGVWVYGHGSFLSCSCFFPAVGVGAYILYSIYQPATRSEARRDIYNLSPSTDIELGYTVSNLISDI